MRDERLENKAGEVLSSHTQNYWTNGIEDINVRLLTRIKKLILNIRKVTIMGFISSHE